MNMSSWEWRKAGAGGWLLIVDYIGPKRESGSKGETGKTRFRDTSGGANSSGGVSWMVERGPKGEGSNTKRIMKNAKFELVDRVGS